MNEDTRLNLITFVETPRKFIFGKVVLRGAQRLQHSLNRTTCSGLLKTALNNVLLPTLFNVVNNIVQHCWAWIHLSEVQRKTGAELVYNGTVGPNLGRHLLFCSQIRPTMPLETSSAPVFLWTSERRISLRSDVTMLNKLLTTLNNMGSKTLFNPVFNNPEQVVRFSMCMIILSGTQCNFTYIPAKTDPVVGLLDCAVFKPDTLPLCSVGSFISPAPRSFCFRSPRDAESTWLSTWKKYFFAPSFSHLNALGIKSKDQILIKSCKQLQTSCPHTCYSIFRNLFFLQKVWHHIHFTYKAFLISGAADMLYPVKSITPPVL